jgi:hypothetical protein
MEGVSWTKVKYTHSRGTLRNPFDLDINTNNERLNCKIGTVCVGGY